MSIGQTGSYRQVSDQVAPRETVFYVISVVSVNWYAYFCVQGLVWKALLVHYLRVAYWSHLLAWLCCFQMYRGPTCSYHLSGLHPDTEYSVRVYGMRITGCNGDEVIGIPSVETVFKTLPQRSVNLHSDGMMGTSRTGSSGTSDGGLLLSRWSDQQCAIMLLLVFAVCALLTAFLAQQVVVYSTSVSDEMAASVHDLPSRADSRHPDVHWLYWCVRIISSWFDR